MGWMDYKKDYDMVPHSWIGQVLVELKLVKNIKRLIVNCMQNWSTQLETLDGQELGKMQIKRGLFSKRWFVISPPCYGTHSPFGAVEKSEV